MLSYSFNEFHLDPEWLDLLGKQHDMKVGQLIEKALLVQAESGRISFL